MSHSKNAERPAGYAALIARYGLRVPAPRHLSGIAAGTRSVRESVLGVEEAFPPSFERDTSDVGQLLFALKYDGVDLTVLRAIFEAMGPSALEQAIRKRPASAYLRRLWFFYEWLLQQSLSLPDATTGAYVDALDKDAYITQQNAAKLRRYRVNFNLLAPTPHFCPIVRRTKLLAQFAEKELHRLAARALVDLSPRDLMRAIRFLYTKETRASYDIERQEPSSRAERFVEALFSHTNTDHYPWWDVEQLTAICKELIGDVRYEPQGLRTEEVRVSEQRLLSLHERVHYIAPRHKDLELLMSGFVAMWSALFASAPMPARLGEPYTIQRALWATPLSEPFYNFVVASCLSFGFVYLHPFVDGNGRLHRMIFHRVLASSAFTPNQVVIPVSAAIAHDQAGYDAALEDFSKRVLPFIEYTIAQSDGRLSVQNETAWLYRYPDLTVQVEALCGWFEHAVEHELTEELAVLRAIDEAKRAMREVLDAMPDAKQALFLQVCLQNQRNGRGFSMSRRKRESLFPELTDEEVGALEQAVAEAFTGIMPG